MYRYLETLQIFGNYINKYLVNKILYITNKIFGNV